VFRALEVYYDNALYKFTFDIDIDIVLYKFLVLFYSIPHILKD